MEQSTPLRSDLKRIFNQWLSAPELRSEVRGYLRHRLFTALHNSRVGGSLGQLDVQPVSPKLQTLNLLIAEYLLKMRHHFTLSVFSCEAPNVACVSPNLPEVLKQSSGRSVHVFSKQDLDDVLDTLGLAKDAPPVQALRRMYEQDAQKALLTCILRSLPDMLTQGSAPSAQAQVEIPPENTAKNLDVDELKRMHHEDVNALTEHFHQELSIKEEALRNLRMVVENANAFQQNGLVESLQEKISDIEAKYKNFEAVKEREVLHLKKLNRSLEHEMDELQGKLESRKKSIRDEEFRIEREKLALRREKKKLQKHQKQLDEVSIALTEHFPDQSTLPGMEMQLHIKDQEIIELRNKCLNYQDENKMLNSLTEQQRSRIETLNEKISSLVAELQAYRDQAKSKMLQSASEGDSSPTEEVIKDARRRIKSLEEEFEAIERQHSDFRNRSLDESAFPARTPPIFHQSPPVRAATSDLRGSNLVGDIHSSIKSIYESVQPKPERLSPKKLRFQTPNINLLDASTSSLSLESTGIEPRTKFASKAGPSGFSQRLEESISPILSENLVSEGKKSPLLVPSKTIEAEERPAGSAAVERVGHSSPELSEIRFNIEPEALGTSDELKLTMPSSSSGGSSNIIEATKLETTVTDKVKPTGDTFTLSAVRSPVVKSKSSRTAGDGMVETSTSDDKSEPIIATAPTNNEDDDFWDM